MRIRHKYPQKGDFRISRLKNVRSTPYRTRSYLRIGEKEIQPREAGFIPPWFVAACGDMLLSLENGWSKPES
jgi:hypothetical protein